MADRSAHIDDWRAFVAGAAPAAVVALIFPILGTSWAGGDLSLHLTSPWLQLLDLVPIAVGLAAGWGQIRAQRTQSQLDVLGHHTRRLVDQLTDNAERIRRLERGRDSVKEASATVEAVLDTRLALIESLSATADDMLATVHAELDALAVDPASRGAADRIADHVDELRHLLAGAAAVAERDRNTPSSVRRRPSAEPTSAPPLMPADDDPDEVTDLGPPPRVVSPPPDPGSPPSLGSQGGSQGPRVRLGAVDPHTLVVLREALDTDDHDAVTTMIGLFLDDLPRLRDTLWQATRATERRRVARLVRGLRRQAGQLGAKAVVRRADQVLDAARDGAPHELEMAVRYLLGEVDAAAVELTNYRRRYLSAG